MTEGTPPFDILQADSLAGIPHGFFGSSGGAHQFGFGGPGSDESVLGTRGAAASAIIPDLPLLTPHQVHSPDVLIVDGEIWEDAPTGRPVGDAIATVVPGVVIGIVTADCAPVLFADHGAGVVGAAHAGWRGAHGGVLENTLEAMESLGARRENTVAAIGPTIAQASYEVDAPFRANFTAADERFFVRGREGRWQFDLPAYVLHRLEAHGIGQATNVNRDTFSLANDYYSYRRATQSGESNYGRQISMLSCP